MHLPRFSHDGRWIAGWRHDNSIGVCETAAGGECRGVGRGIGVAVWSTDDTRLYILRNAAAGGEQEVWSVGIDGLGERKERNVGTFRSIDRFFDLSINGEMVFAPFFEGRREIWTAKVQ
jgi:hypothetical protein